MLLSQKAEKSQHYSQKHSEENCQSYAEPSIKSKVPQMSCMAESVSLGYHTSDFLYQAELSEKALQVSLMNQHLSTYDLVI